VCGEREREREREMRKRVADQRKTERKKDLVTLEAT
jgi:hypothetical protein